MAAAIRDFPPDGVWPTMITPYTENNEIDVRALEQMIEWYIRAGVSGLFAVCLSSEMLYLSLDERVQLARFVKETASGKIPVIASGHNSDDMADQIRELNAIAATGVDGLVLVVNRLAQKGETDAVWRKNLEYLLKYLPENVPLGFYECPLPYKRLIKPEQLAWYASTGRFLFLKDTSCDNEIVSSKLAAVSGTGLKIYNANSSTLLDSLRMGASGYSGVMANFHPDLYAWAVKNWKRGDALINELFDFLGVASLIERQFYPVNAKYYLQLEGIKINLFSRARNYSDFTSSDRREVDQLHALSKIYTRRIADADAIDSI